MNQDRINRKTDRALKELYRDIQGCSASQMKWNPEQITVCAEARAYTPEESQILFCYGLDRAWLALRCAVNSFVREQYVEWYDIIESLPSGWEVPAEAALMAKIHSRAAEIYVERAAELGLPACIWSFGNPCVCEQTLTFRGLNRPSRISRAFSADALLGMRDFLPSTALPCGRSLFRECLFGTEWTEGWKLLQDGTCPDLDALRQKLLPLTGPCIGEPDGPSYLFPTRPDLVKYWS